MDASQVYTVTLLSITQATVEFPCSVKTSVLRAAKNAGFELSAGCMQGRCYTCRSRLRSGTVKNSRALSRYATIDPSNLGEGRILLCSVAPTSDIEVAPEGPWEQIPEKSSEC